jgi:hypothetical protein
MEKIPNNTSVYTNYIFIKVIRLSVDTYLLYLQLLYTNTGTYQEIWLFQDTMLHLSKLKDNLMRVIQYTVYE